MVFCWTGLLPIAIALIVLVPSILVAFDITPSTPFLACSILLGSLKGVRHNSTKTGVNDTDSPASIAVSNAVSNPICKDLDIKSVLEKYFGEAHAKDDGGPTVNPHILAKRHLESGKPVTLELINELIGYYKHPLITQEAFASLEKAQWKFFDLPLSPESRKQLISYIGSGDSNSKVRLAGVYQFVDKVTNEPLYVGGSVNLGSRVNAYLKRNGNTIKGPIGVVVREKLSRLKVGVLVLELKYKDLYTAIEQFFILSLNPLLNVIKVSGSGGPTIFSVARRKDQIQKSGKPTYMYSGDKTTLLHVFDSTRDAARQLGLAVNSINTGLKNDRTVKGFYFTCNKLVSANVNILNVSDLLLLIPKGFVSAASHNTNYYVSDPDATDVLRMDHIANVKQYVSFVGLDATLVNSNTIINLTEYKPKSTIGDLCIELEDNGNPLGNTLYPNAVDWNPNTYSSTDLSNMLPLLKPVVFKRRKR